MLPHVQVVFAIVFLSAIGKQKDESFGEKKIGKFRLTCNTVLHILCVT